MRILALADIHGRLPVLDVSQVDCVMIAGDICPDEVEIASFQVSWLEEVFSPWVESLIKPVYLTLGNHDFCDYFVGPPNLRYGTEKIIDQVLLFSWSPIFADYAWESCDEEMEMKLESLLAEASTIPPIWLTHSPPFGLCDKTHGDNVGSRVLRAAVDKYQPKVLICGHIHAGVGMGWLGRTRVYNVSIVYNVSTWETGPCGSGQPVLIEV